MASAANFVSQYNWNNSSNQVKRNLNKSIVSSKELLLKVINISKIRTSASALNIFNFNFSAIKF
jgi:hypothetical protein